MTVFEMVKYHGQTYPREIPLRVEEVAGHFDIERINHSLRYSLHTEYSYGKRKFESGLISSFPALAEAQKNGGPQLWKNKERASQFADFVFALAGDDAPAVIEVHTPFNDYTDMETVCLLSKKNAKPKDCVEISVDAEDYYRIKSSEKDI